MIFRTFLLKPLSLLTLPLTALSLLLISGERISAQPIVPANDGTGTIVSPDGNTFNIQGGQLSADQANLFHSFQQFGLNPDQIANFLSQPNIRNILGRVVGGDPSIIQGLIRVSGGNTNLYLMNPSGIVFGPTARLDVPANFAATTATSIQFDREFFNAIGSNNYSALSGNPNAYVFSSKTGDIINAGELNLEPGKVLTLIANTVTNTGEISTEGGQVILASMPEPGVVRLSQPGQVLSVEYEVGDSAPTDTPISVADLSEILNQTQDYDLGFTLNADGSVQLSVSPIKIAPNPGTTIASGSIDVSGETGGQVSVLGETIAVIDADIDASGTNLGGVIHIGGELQGQGTTPTAQRTVVDSSSILKVDAVDQGNGGEAIVWADGRTDFAGTISAKGGANGGDGGFVEVSGKDSLGFTGTVDTTATNGRVGTLLLDSTNITIIDDLSPGSPPPELSDGVIDAEELRGEDLTLSSGLIESLLSSSRVSLAATNNITIADLTDNTLGNFSSSRGNLTLAADADNSGAGSVSMNSGDTIAIGGNINLSGASLTLGGLQSFGTINLTASNGNASLNGFVSGNGVTLTSVGNITTSSGLSSGAGQNLSLTSSSGAIDTRAGTLSTSSSSSSSGSTGNITLDAAGNIQTGRISTASSTSSSGTISSVNAGSVQITSRSGSIDTSSTTTSSSGIVSGGINSSSFSGTGGAVTLQAAQNVTVGTIDSSGATAGGNITVQAETSITTGAVNSSSTLGSGGDVLLDPTGDIEVDSINTQGGTQLGSSSASSASSSVTGGDVTIVTKSNFRALGSFIDQNGINASISTAAPGGGGRISISHGKTYFTIGQALSPGSGNGVVGALTSGNFTIFPYNIDPTSAAALANGNPFLIAPKEGYRFTERFPTLENGFNDAIGAIGIFSVDSTCQGDNCNPPPKQTCEDVGDCPVNGPSNPDNQILSIDEARDILALVEQRSGIKPALIYVSFQSPDFQLRPSEDQFTQNESRYSEQYENYLNVPDRTDGVPLNLEPSDQDILQLLVVTSSEEPFLISVPGATRDRVVFNGGRMLNSIVRQEPEGAYLRSSQQLYSQLMKPISAVLEERQVDNLVFIMDNSLRLLPIAALHDGEQYLIEKYSVGLMPSLSLTDTRFVDIKEVGLLAMGADTFSDEAPLPAVPTELSVISDLWNAPAPLLNDRFTLDNLRSSRENQRYGILHLATHGDFNPGTAAESYIRFGDRRVTLDQLRTLRLYDPTVELMVLSACRTAVGNPEAELGFAGLAHQAGVKTALGSLWYVGDQATLSLMTSFYANLREAPIKAEALREAQLAMLRGGVSLENGTISINRGNGEQQFPLRGEALEAIEALPVDLKHPYAWSAFTMIGSPW